MSTLRNSDGLNVDGRAPSSLNLLKKVHNVEIWIRYDGSSDRPIRFDVTYKIDDVEYFERIKKETK